MGSIARGPDGGAPAGSPRSAPVGLAELPATGHLFILSGPSGVGKTTIIRQLKASGFPLGYCVTVTTRARRPDERDGVDYHFLSRQQFEQLLESGGLLEHAVVHGRDHYGIPIAGLRNALHAGNDVLIPPEVQGAATVRSKLPNAISIFLMPGNIEELVRRLSERRSESREQMEARLATALAEMERVSEYDYVVVNEDGKVDEAVETIKGIITAERCRTEGRQRLVTL